MRNCRFLGFILLSVAVLALPAHAQTNEPYTQINDRFRIYLGGFFPDVDSKISINGINVQPPPISVEDVLNLEDGNSVLWGGARWRISRRNNLEFEFFKLNRDGLAGVTIDPVAVGDYIVESGGIESTFDISLARLTYGFSLIRKERMDWQLKAGLHLADLSTSLGLIGNVCDTTTTPPEAPPCPLIGSPQQVAESITAPLPHFGTSFAYSITHSIAARLQVIGFAIEIDNIDGSLVEIDADLAWQPWRHFGVGAGVRYFNVDVEATSSRLNGKFEFEYFGPVVYVQTSF